MKSLFVFLFGFVMGSPAIADQLTNPLVDEAKLIAPDRRGEVEEALRNLKAEKDIWLVVWTKPSLNGQSIETVAVDQFKAWNIGDKVKDNGMLLVVAAKERKMRLEVGYGLEGNFPDITAKSLLEEVVRPQLKQGDFASGVLDLISKIRAEDVPEFPETLPETPSVAQVQIREWREQNPAEELSPWRILSIGTWIMFGLIGLGLGSTYKRKKLIVDSLRLPEAGREIINSRLRTKTKIFFFAMPALVTMLIGITLFMEIGSSLIALLTAAAAVVILIGWSFWDFRRSVEQVLVYASNEYERAVMREKLYSVREGRSSGGGGGSGGGFAGDSSSGSGWSSSDSGSSSSSSSDSSSGGGSSGGGGASSDW